MESYKRSYRFRRGVFKTASAAFSCCACCGRWRSWVFRHCRSRQPHTLQARPSRRQQADPEIGASTQDRRRL